MKILILILFVVEKLLACHKEFDFHELHVSAVIRCGENSSISILQKVDIDEDYIQIVIIENTKIPKLPALTFSKFGNLTELHLSKIQIESIEAGAFNNLQLLEELYLDGNELREIKKDIFNPLHNLQILDLANNQISVIEQTAFVGADSLYMLSLENNKISVIEDGFFQTQNELFYLDLTGNSINSFSANDLTGLKTLSLAECDLFSFDVDLSNLTMSLLNLSSNQLSTVNFTNFCNVEQLDLSKNSFVLFEDRPCLLHELYLAHNQITGLEDSFFENSRDISVIDFGYNQISVFDRYFFRGLTQLKRLTLRHNNLTRIYPSQFEDLEKLNSLDLSYNKIEQIMYGTFRSLYELEILDLSYNKIKNLQDYVFHSVNILKSLALEHNQLSSFHVRDYLKHLKMLRNISINYNSWYCKDLVVICRLLQIENVRLINASSYDVENVSGVRCTSTRRSFNGNSFFNEDFKRSNFFQFFDRDYKRSGFFKTFAQRQQAPSVAQKIVFPRDDPRNYTQNILVFSAITQVIIAVLLLLNRFKARNCSS